MKLPPFHNLALISVVACSVFPGGTRAREVSIGATAKVDVRSHNRAGVDLMNRFLYREAAEEFRKALAEDPNFNLARINLGIALYYDAELDAARQVFEEALARDPANPYANYSLGLVLKHKGLTDEAEACFRRVADADPKCAAAFYNLGAVHARLPVGRLQRSMGGEAGRAVRAAPRLRRRTPPRCGRQLHRHRGHSRR